MFMWWESKTEGFRQQRTRQHICPCKIYDNFGWCDVLTFVSFDHFPVHPPWLRALQRSGVAPRVNPLYLCRLKSTPSPYLNFPRINSTNTFTQQLELQHTPQNITLPFAAQTIQQTSHGCFVHNFIQILWHPDQHNWSFLWNSNSSC